MKFVYSFDAEKTHQLEFNFTVLQYIQKINGALDIIFFAEIKEKINGIVKRMEVETKTFTYLSSSSMELHDIDFARIRYSAEKKWIFSITNNKKVGEKVEIGLISDTANKNPLFLDIYHDETEYEMALKGNNISILDGNFVVPLLRQTVVNHRFETAGFPEGFTSSTSSYISDSQYMELNEFVYDLPQTVSNAPFSIKAYIAPVTLDSTKDASIFSFTVSGLGKFKLFRNRMEYLAQGMPLEATYVSTFAQEIQLIEFFDIIFKTASVLEFTGDGLGSLVIKYKGATINTTYSPTEIINNITFRGAYKLTTTEEIPANRLRHRIDNLSVTFQK